MYDTIHLTVPMDSCGSSNNKLHRFKTAEKSFTNGGAYSTGCIIGLHVVYTDKKIKIEGSVPKYLFGNNIRLASFNHISQFITSVSHEIGIDISKAKIRRVDSASNLSLTYHPGQYLDSLTELKGYEKVRYPYSINFRNKKGVSVKFYDKGAEVSSRLKPIPKGVNCLRYEIAWTKKSLRAKLPSLNLNSLTEEEVESMFNDSMVNIYESISKPQYSVLELSSISSPRDLNNALAHLGYSTLLSQSHNDLISLLRSQKVFKFDAHYSRVKAKMAELEQKFGNNNSNKLIEELSNSILKELQPFGQRSFFMP